eukprot:TRINITY_DN1076_c4_g1_i1.p1 TRINITY_DN1076_c4_g1~~TRINITY_DN1076_c4_g1_i1.p1  ORF type:complete len:1793 (+),score=600.34 TRINITY_DN1076_c4_g1_i1:79-5379(+)
MPVPQRRATVTGLGARNARRKSRGLDKGLPNGLQPKFDVCGDVLLACGNCKDGQLGLPEVPEDGCLKRFTRVSPPAAVPLPPGQRPPLAALSGVASVSCGWASTYVRMHDGRLLVTGKNANGQLGLGHTEDQTELVPVSGVSNVVSVHAGAHHCFLCLADGTLLVTGCNDDGQLGTGTTDGLDTFSVASSLHGHRAVEAACGGNHSLVVTDEGQVFAAGQNQDGQLGLGHRTSQIYFELVRSLDGVHVTGARCGGFHSFVVTADGEVYAAGRGDEGQLGGLSSQLLFTLIDNLGRGAQDIACGWAFSVCVMRDDMVYMCGKNDDGQLGRGQKGRPQKSWELVEGLVGHEIVAVTCGRSHVLALTVTRQLLCCGLNRTGQLGTLPDDSVVPAFTACPDVDDPAFIKPLDPVVAIAAGAFHSVVVAGKAMTAGLDPPPPDFVPDPTCWSPTAEGCAAARVRRLHQLSADGVADLELVAREEDTAREHIRRHYGWEAAVRQRFDLLRAIEHMERGAVLTDEHGDRAALAMHLTNYHFHCHRFWDTCFEQERLERDAVVDEEEADWRSLVALFGVVGRTVCAQTGGRLELLVAEMRQAEMLQRDAMRANHFLEHARYTQIYLDATERLRWSLVEADRIRAIPTVLPEPTELLAALQPALQWDEDLAALRRGGSLDQARTAAAASFRELDTKAKAARSGDVKAIARRDYQLVHARSAAELWQTELNAKPVANTCLRATMKGGWDPPAGDWGPPGRHVELKSWADELTRLLAERGGAPADVRLPGRDDTGVDAMHKAAMRVKEANDRIRDWRMEYKAAVSRAQSSTDNNRKICYDLFEIPLRPWIPCFNALDKAIQDEERVKALPQGVSPQPEELVALAAAEVLAAIARTDAQLRAVAAERVDVVRHLELLAATVDAQMRFTALRKKVSKENRRRAGLQALRQALDFGALSEADYDRQRQLLEAPPELQKVPSVRGLWELREEVRSKKFALEAAEDRVRRTGLYKEEDREVSIEETSAQVRDALSTLRDAKRRLHVEQSAVRVELDFVWSAVAPYLPDLTEEIRRVTGSDLARELAVVGEAALPLIVDRRRGEYEFEDSIPVHVDGRGRQRLLWCKFDGDAFVLKEYRVEEVFSGPPAAALREFAKWLGICAQLRHSAIAPVRAVFGEIDDDETEVFYLQFERYDTDLRQWMRQPQPGDEAEQARAVLHVLQSLLAGLAFMHCPRDNLPDGVVHGNIGASNILMRRGNPLYNDLEPAPDAPPPTGTNKRRPLEMRGTVPAYAAPELVYAGSAVRNDKAPTRMSDVYALGRTVEELLKCPAAAGLRQMESRRGGQSLDQSLARLAAQMVVAEPGKRPTAAAAAAEFGLVSRGWDPKLANHYESVVAVEREQDQVRAFLAELLATRPMVWMHGAPPVTDDGLEHPRFTIERFGVVVEKVPDAARSAQNQYRWEQDKLRSEAEDKRLDSILYDLRYRASTGEMRVPDYWGSREIDGGRAPLFPLGPSPGAGLDIVHIGRHTDKRALELLREGFQSRYGSAGPRLSMCGAWRTENHVLWRLYANARQQTRLHRTKDSVAMDLPRGVQLEPRLLELSRSLAPDIDALVNETYMFCPVRSDAAFAALAYGCRLRFCPGVQGFTLDLAENPAACDVHASSDIQDGAFPDLHTRIYRAGVKHPGKCYYMLLCRVVLGRVCGSANGSTNLDDKQPLFDDPRPFRGPEGEACFVRDLRNIPGKDVRYHSLVTEPGSGRPYRCVTVYDRNRVLPEYLIAYSRE